MFWDCVNEVEIRGNVYDSGCLRREWLISAPAPPLYRKKGKIKFSNTRLPRFSNNVRFVNY